MRGKYNSILGLLVVALVLGGGESAQFVDEWETERKREVEFLEREVRDHVDTLRFLHDMIGEGVHHLLEVAHELRESQDHEDVAFRREFKEFRDMLADRGGRFHHEVKELRHEVEHF